MRMKIYKHYVEGACAHIHTHTIHLSSYICTHTHTHICIHTIDIHPKKAAKLETFYLAGELRVAGPGFGLRLSAGVLGLRHLGGDAAGFGAGPAAGHQLQPRGAGEGGGRRGDRGEAQFLLFF